MVNVVLDLLIEPNRQAKIKFGHIFSVSHRKRSGAARPQFLPSDFPRPVHVVRVVVDPVHVAHHPKVVIVLDVDAVLVIRAVVARLQQTLRFCAAIRWKEWKENALSESV